MEVLARQVLIEGLGTWPLRQGAPTQDLSGQRTLRFRKVLSAAQPVTHRRGSESLALVQQESKCFPLHMLGLHDFRFWSVVSEKQFSISLNRSELVCSYIITLLSPNCVTPSQDFNHCLPSVSSSAECMTSYNPGKTIY